MPVNDRNLQGGEKLVARYKGQEHTVLVLADDKGGLGFELDGSTIYKSLSSAGSAVMGGTACNGWRFWTPEGELKERTPKEPKAKAGTAKAEKNGRIVKQIKKVANQKTTPVGKVRWFCSACMAGFLHDAGEVPAVCPSGHPAEVEDELAPVS